MAHLGAPMAVRVAATLRIADHIAAGLRGAPELAAASGADADALERLLRYLAVRGVLSRDEAGGYTLTELGEPLRGDHPAGLRSGLDIEGVGRSELAFVQLLHSVRTGEAAFPKQFGVDFWQDLAADPARREAFAALMGSYGPSRSSDLMRGFDWGSLGRLVDVGGGSGAMLIALLSHYPRLRGTLVDLAENAEDARAALAAAGLADRGEVMTGSFFDPLPAGAGGYLLSLIIHDWADEPARQILRRCAEAAGTSGAVLVVERVSADSDSPHNGMDLRMLALYGGKERRIAELAALARDAGLVVAAVHPAADFSIVELRAAEQA
ncbi:MAG: methyltransferase [Jatrophihabitantaceae bacterium]